MGHSAQFANSRNSNRESIPPKKHFFGIRTQEVIENKAQPKKRQPKRNPKNAQNNPRTTQANPRETQENPGNSRPPALRAAMPGHNGSPPLAPRNVRFHPGYTVILCKQKGCP
jgi:hypothetical protein